MADDFFKTETKVESPVETPAEEVVAEKIKVGEEEFTPDELNRLVGLGKIGVESEEKYGVTLDKVWPNLQKTINEKIAAETKLADLEKPKVEAKTPTEQEVTDAEIARQAKEQLSKLGYVPADEVRKIVVDTVAGYRLLDDAQAIIEEMTTDGGPATTVDDLLKHMDETGIRNPEKAYKDMFEKELDVLKEKKLASLKSPGLVTEEASSAGSKVPAPQKITKDNLSEALNAALRGNQ